VPYINQAIRYLNKQEAQQVVCPQCTKPIGEPCFAAGVRGARPHNHAIRVNAAARQLGITLPHLARRQRVRATR
jgi:hypothetical protein